MRTMLVLVATAALALTLLGCASSGPTIENAQLAELQQGKTTADEVMRRLGQPSFNSNNLDGTRTTAYLEPGSRSDATAMVALVGAIASGTTPNVNSVIFRFDTSGRLSEYTRTTETTVESGPERAEAVRPAPAPAPSAGAATPSSTAAASSMPATHAPTTGSTPVKTTPRQQTRGDDLPGWLPSSSTRDPRDPH